MISINVYGFPSMLKDLQSEQNGGSDQACGDQQVDPTVEAEAGSAA